MKISSVKIAAVKSAVEAGRRELQAASCERRAASDCPRSPLPTSWTDSDASSRAHIPAPSLGELVTLSVGKEAQYCRLVGMRVESSGEYMGSSGATLSGTTIVLRHQV